MDPSKLNLNSESFVDFITGREVPNIGAEANRQLVERLLVEEKGYKKEEIEVDVPIVLEMGEQPYRSHLDLVVRVTGWRYMVIKCAAGSLASREREVISAARLLDLYQIPLAVVSDGPNGDYLGYDQRQVKGSGIGGHTGPAASPANLQSAAAAAPGRIPARTPAIDFPLLRQHERACQTGVMPG
jgi:hypothetical protein